MKLFNFFRSRKEENENIEAPLSDDSAVMSDNDVAPQALQAPQTPQANKSNEIPDTNALLEKLKDIAEDSTEYQISYGAMCYCPAGREPNYISCKCSLCKCKIGRFEKHYYSDIVKQSGLVKKTGLAEVKIVCIDCLIKMCQSGGYSYDIKDWDIYDSMVQDYESSTDKKALDIDDMTLLEWMGESQRHLRERKKLTDSDGMKRKYTEPDYLVFLFQAADSDKPHLTVIYPNNLAYFLNFIQNKQTWESKYGATILLRDNIKIIERLTGLKL